MEVLALSERRVLRAAVDVAATLEDLAIKEQLARMAKTEVTEPTERMEVRVIRVRQAARG